MLGYGHDESAPTPGGVFAPHFVGGCYIISKPFATLSQTVSSRRGPIYRARIYVNTHVMGDEYAYLIMGKCVFGNANMHFWQCQDTGAMNRPLRLTECFAPISWVYVECLQSVRHVIGRPLAAVGADLSRPHIRKHPRNGERKFVCGGTNVYI